MVTRTTTPRPVNVRTGGPVYTRRVTDQEGLTAHRGHFDRTSLRAVIAGTITALVIMLAMSVLGLAIGATTLDAMIDFNEDPAFDPGTGVVIWLAATNLLALFAGGWVAGHLNGAPDETDGMIHGFLVWALVTLISLYLFTTTAGNFLSGAAVAVGEGLSVISEGIEAVVPEAAAAIEGRDFRMSSILAEAEGLAADTGDPSLQPGAIEEQGEEAGEIIDDTAQNIATDPASAGAQISAAVERLLRLDAPSDADRQDVINVITARTNLTEEEARQMVINWEQQFDEIEVTTQNTINQVSEDVTEAVAKAAGVVFMAMVLGAFAGALGGYIGAPELSLVEEVVQQREEEVIKATS